MADTGFKVCGTVESNAWSGLAVTAAKLATADDDRATTGSLTFEAAEISDFAYGVPAGATIDGIEVVAQFRNSSIYTSTLQLSLSHNDGTNYTATKSDTVVGTTDTDKTYGGAADTWGRTWSQAEFADGTFRLKLEGKASNAGSFIQLDYLAVKVYYTEAADIEGTLDKTLGAITITGAGSLDIEGTLDKSLGAITLTGEATVEDQSGVLDKSLGAITITGTGSLDIEGTLDKSLGAIAITGTGSLDIEGTLSQSLGAISITGAGSLDIEGTLDKNLGAISITGAGSLDIEGTLSQSLGVILTGEATVEDQSGVLSQSLGAITLTAKGVRYRVKILIVPNRYSLRTRRHEMVVPERSTRIEVEP